MIDHPKPIRAFVALVALGSATAARATETVCVTPAELDAIFAYALPTVIDSAAQTCRPVLPRDGYLATQGAGLAARYRAGQAAARPLARAAALKIGQTAAGSGGSGIGKLAALLPDGALQGFAAGYVGQFVEQSIHPGDCRDIEQALRLMAPLPPENTAGLISLILRRFGNAHDGNAHNRANARSAGRTLHLPICPVVDGDGPVLPSPSQ